MTRKIHALLVVAGLGHAMQFAPHPIAAQKKDAKTVHSVATIRLMPGTPDPKDFTDYITLSPDGSELYAGFASRDSVVFVDTKTNTVTATVGDLTNVRGLAAVPKVGLGFTSNAKDNSVGVVDLKSHKLLKKIATGKKPDGILYVAPAGLVYVCLGVEKAAALIDPATQKIVATIPLGGKPEFPVADPQTGLVYQQLEDTNELVVVDLKKQKVTARHKIVGGDEPTGIAFDKTHKRLFIACHNEKLIVMDSDSGKVITSLPIGAGVDGAVFDPSLRRIYTSNGKSATMTVVQQEAADKYAVLENVPTHEGAHALTLDTKTHRIYVVYGGEIAVYDAVK